MISFSLPFSSLSRCFPISSVSFPDLSPPPEPPPAPLSSPTPPEPPEPPDPLDPQIRLSSGEAHAQSLLLQLLTGSQQVHSVSELSPPPPSRFVPPCRKFVLLSIAALAPRRSSRHHDMLLHSRSSNSNLGFHCLGQIWVSSVLGHKWMVCLLGLKRRVFVLGLSNPISSPLSSLYRTPSCVISLTLRFHPSHLFKPRLFFSLHPISSPQVCSCSSLSYSSTLGSYWMKVEIMALALWNSDLILTPLWSLDILGSIFVLSRGTLIALVRNFTAVCRFYFNLAPLKVALWQIGKRSLLSFTVPVFLVHRGFYSPHLSFMELIFLPNTSLEFSGIVIGSIIVKTVLLGVEARIVVQDSFRSAIVDCLALEALFPPACGFGKDYRFEDDYSFDGLCLVSALVELFSSPLSVCLYLSFVANFSFLSYAITLLVGSAPCSFDVSSFYGG